VALPLFFPRNPYAIHILVIACIQTIAALGLNLQVGNTGLPNLGFAAFYGIGAYASALLTVDMRMSFWLGLVAAIVTSALFGLILGFPALRTRPVYLALVTIASGLILYNLFLNVAFLHGPDGVRGIPAPVVLGRSLFSDASVLGISYPSQMLFYFLCLGFLAITVAVVRLVEYSPTGIELNAIRENEIAARSVGINVAKGKLVAFAVGSVFGGLAGALYAHYIGYISAQNFTIGVSFAFLAMVILGGSGNILGVTVAAVLLTILPEKFRALSDYRLLAYGVLIVTMLIFRPRGLIPERIRDYPIAGDRSRKVPI
jgi:branched-chain amino acid transport system permease protein